MSKQESETSEIKGPEFQALTAEDVQKIVSDFFAATVAPELDQLVTGFSEATAKLASLDDLVHGAVADAFANHAAASATDSAAAADDEREAERQRIEREAGEARERAKAEKAQRRQAERDAVEAIKRAADDFADAGTFLDEPFSNEGPLDLRFAAGATFVPGLPPINVTGKVAADGTLDLRVEFNGAEPPATIDHAWLIGDGFTRAAQLGAGLRIGSGASAAIPAGHLKF